MKGFLADMRRYLYYEAGWRATVLFLFLVATILAVTGWVFFSLGYERCLTDTMGSAPIELAPLPLEPPPFRIPDDPGLPVRL